MKRLVLLVPVVLLISGFAAGCGGGSDDSGSSGSLSKTEFTTKADDLCAKGNLEIQHGVEVALGKQKPTKALIVSITKNTILPGLESQLKQLKALDPPAGDTAGIDTFLSAFADDLENLKKDPVTAVGDPMANSTKAAQNYGFTNCGTFGTGSGSSSSSSDSSSSAG